MRASTGKTSIALLTAASLAAGCARTGHTPDDMLVVVTEGRIRDLDPRFALTNYDNKLSRLVTPGLMSIDQASMEPRLELAESLEQLDDTTWEVVVRPDARFPNGAPVTAADVVYTFASTMDETVGSIYRDAWRERISRVEARDERTVRFHLQQPVATFPSDLDYGIVSARAATGWVVGAGPYRVVATWGERVWLQRNWHYYGARPPVSFIEVRTIRDANARFLLLVGGDADLAQNGVRVDLVSALEQRPSLRVMQGPSALLTYLMMNNEDERLSDVRVRRAIAYAVDRERIVSAKFHDRAILATGLLPPMHWAYRGDVRRYDYDPERAMQLLDEAGYPDPPGGEPRMRLVYKTSADQFRVAIARVIASQLGEVGIEVEVRSFEFGTFFEDIKRGEFEIATMQTAPIVEPDWYYTYFHSASIPHEGNWGLHNRWRFRNDRADALMTEGRRTADRDARMRIYAEVQQILAEQVPVIPLWHEDNIVVTGQRVQGYELLPSARLRGLEKARKVSRTR